MSWPRWLCPSCGDALESTTDGALECSEGRHSFCCHDGIWRLLPDDRQVIFDRFLSDYRVVRHGEGRGSDDPAYFRALPYRDLSGRYSSDWQIRARSYRYLLRRVVSPLARRTEGPLTILDLGAGNCWLSNRLALEHHRCVALDLATDDGDGLGAHRFYESSFVPVQAEFDRLPLAPEQFDLAIFNGSLHYATSYESSLGEALRVLQSGGTLVVMESPVYRRAESGQQMVREREELFEKLHGFPSNALPFENFLTYERLGELAAVLGIQWKLRRPCYGLRWALRPWRARLHRDREPARFLFAIARKPR
jgi:ubiquinone/menaquinone biosynthesis C-methylase UbiE